jgi:hypothetical protein
LLRANQNPSKDFTREPKDALTRLRRHWADFVANLEKMIDSARGA